MGAEVNRNRAEGSQFSKEFFAVGGVEVVGLVGAKVVPDGGIGANGLICVDLDRDWRRSLGLLRLLKLGEKPHRGRQSRGQEGDEDQ